jgi:hypothetical protein
MIISINSDALAANEPLFGRPAIGIWAILGNARRQRWQIWQSRQRGFCNLQMAGPT